MIGCHSSTKGIAQCCGILRHLFPCILESLHCAMVQAWDHLHQTLLLCEDKRITSSQYIVECTICCCGVVSHMREIESIVKWVVVKLCEVCTRMSCVVHVWWDTNICVRWMVCVLQLVTWGGSDTTYVLKLFRAKHRLAKLMNFTMTAAWSLLPFVETIWVTTHLLTSLYRLMNRPTGPLLTSPFFLCLPWPCLAASSKSLGCTSKNSENSVIVNSL